MAYSIKFHVLTLFPEIPRAFFTSSIMAKAVQKEIIAYDLVNIRDFALDAHKTCDDSPYGGGAGQLLLAEPIEKALYSLKLRKKRVIYMTPSGKPFTQNYAKELSKEKNLVILCGRYEGIDQRIIDSYVDDEISIGDYVLSSGEVAANVLIDAVYRLVDGVIRQESLEEESYTNNLLEYPQYTRPEVFHDMRVPEVLLSGHHKNIAQWRQKMRLIKTLKNRPDLIAKARSEGSLSKEDEKMIEQIYIGEQDGPNKNN